MANKASVSELVQRWQDLHERGRSVTAEELCAENHELLDELKRQIQALLAMEQFLGSTDDEPGVVPDGLAESVNGTETPGIHFGKASTTASGEALVGSRYRPLRLHAHGGLGEVYLARDEELSREVALKRMRRKYAGDPGSHRRFVREGEITGALEHPGVVPVYGLNRDADGQPCFAMRFIRGDTLQDAIATFHVRRAQGLQPPGFHSLSFRQLLGRFVVVCNTLAYAHSRGVIHRDLKPANIMLGDYGETLVVDWGLAKRIDAPEETLPLGRDHLPAHYLDGREGGTATGDVLGTPPFMSPEQAAGRNDAVGPASDIYSLGATLYALLAGSPPFAGDGVLDRVVRGDFPPPRQLRPDTPPALEAICLEAMKHEPAARYATALELAADLERWLADEPVNAYPEPLLLRLARWARRHRTALRAAAVVVLISGVLVALGSWWLVRLQTERRQGVEEALAEVGRLQSQAKWSLARAVLDQAQSRLGDHGPADLQWTLNRMRSDLDLVAQLDAVALARATVVKGKLDDAGADQGYATVFAGAGLGAPGDEPQSVADGVRASAVSRPLVAALDDWADCTEDKDRRQWLLAVARRADPDRWRNAARDVDRWRDRATLERLATEDVALEQPPQLVASVARRLGPLGIDVLRRAQALHPEDFWLTFRLGLTLYKDHPTQAAEYFRAALALRPDTPPVLNNLGNILFDQQRLEEAKAVYLRGCTIDPNHAPLHNGLGNVLHSQRRLKEAEEEFRRAVALVPGFAEAHNSLGAALHDQKRFEEAEAEYRRACEVDQRFAQFRHNLGSVLLVQGRLEEARNEFRSACRLDPKLAISHHNLGVVLAMQGQLVQARTELQLACELDPKKAEYHNFLGQASRALGRLEEAEKSYRRACDLDSKFAASRNGLGSVLWAQGRLEEARVEFRRACELDAKNAGPHVNLGRLLQVEGQLDEALAEFHRASQLGYAAVVSDLHECERLIALRKRLPAIANGLDRPADQKERLAFAALCRFPAEGRYALAARLYSDAFTANPKLTDDPTATHRYDAAGAAARASCGHGRDSRTLDDQQKKSLREQALAWLQAELQQWSERAKSDMPADRALVQQTLGRWQQDADLAGVRQPAGLARLPEAEWRSWLTLWAEVDASRRRAEQGKRR
jgi:serine/threonine-protein kinase